MRDVCDGAALLTVVHCYCPDLMKLEGMMCTLAHTHIQSQHLTNYELPLNLFFIKSIKLSLPTH